MGQDMEANREVTSAQYPKVVSDQKKLTDNLETAGLRLQQLALDMEKTSTSETSTFLQDVKDYIAQKEGVLVAITVMEKEATLVETLLDQSIASAKDNYPIKISKLEKNIDAKHAALSQITSFNAQIEAEVKSLIASMRSMEERTKEYEITSGILQSKQVELEKNLESVTREDLLAAKLLNEQCDELAKDKRSLAEDIVHLNRKLQAMQDDKKQKEKRYEAVSNQIEDEEIAVTNLGNDLSVLDKEMRRLQGEFDQESALLATIANNQKEKENDVKTATASICAKIQQMECLGSAHSGFEESANAFKSTIERHKTEKRDVEDTINGLQRSINNDHPTSEPLQDDLLMVRWKTEQAAKEDASNIEKIKTAETECKKLEGVVAVELEKKTDIVGKIGVQLDLERRFEQHIAANKAVSGTRGGDGGEKGDDLGLLSSQQQQQQSGSEANVISPDELGIDPSLFTRKGRAEEELSRKAAAVSRLREELHNVEHQKEEEVQAITDKHIAAIVGEKVRSSQVLKRMLLDHKAAVAAMKRELEAEDQRFKESIDLARDQHSAREKQIEHEMKRLEAILTEYVRSKTRPEVAASGAAGAETDSDADSRQLVDNDDDDDDSGNDGDGEDDRAGAGTAPTHTKRNVVLPQMSSHQNKSLLEQNSPDEDDDDGVLGDEIEQEGELDSSWSETELEQVGGGRKQRSVYDFPDFDEAPKPEHVTKIRHSKAITSTPAPVRQKPGTAAGTAPSGGGWDESPQTKVLMERHFVEGRAAVGENTINLVKPQKTKAQAAGSSKKH